MKAAFAMAIGVLILTGCGAPRGDVPREAEEVDAIDMGEHARVSIEELAERFPLPDEGQMAVDIIFGPRELAYIHQIRQRLGMKAAFGEGIESDVILWDAGIPDKPYLTKFGGAPYRPADQPWPTHGGRELTFVMQWYFGHSRDIIPVELPGEVLLMFGDCEDADESWWPGQLESIRLEWQRLGIPNPTAKVVVQSRKMARQPLKGVLCRVREFPATMREFPDAWDKIEALGVSEPHLVMTTQASRIGGATFYIQIEPPRADEFLLCTMNSISPQPGERYAFPSREEPLSPEDAAQHKFLLGDVGCMYIFINDDGELRVEGDCY